MAHVWLSGCLLAFVMPASPEQAMMTRRCLLRTMTWRFRLDSRFVALSPRHILSCSVCCWRPAWLCLPKSHVTRAVKFEFAPKVSGSIHPNGQFCQSITGCSLPVWPCGTVPEPRHLRRLPTVSCHGEVATLLKSPEMAGAGQSHPQLHQNLRLACRPSAGLVTFVRPMGITQASDWTPSARN